MRAVITHLFEDAGAIPNHPHLPLVVITHAIDPAARGADLAAIFEEQLQRDGWHAAWRWGVYDFPHYHSTAHEVLGCYRGRATLRLGHTTGVTLEIAAGDAVIIPARVGHQNLGCSDDFHVVGGYPKGQRADLLRGQRGERPAADERIARVPLPRGDPIAGPGGPLYTHWHLSYAGGAG